MWKENWWDWKGTRVHYLEAGRAGSALVLLHGGAADSASRSWERAAEYLHGFRLLAPDFPGFGQSELRNETLDIPFFTNFVADFLEGVGVEPGFLLGFSMGGLVAAHLALRQPDRVSKLVLVGSAGLAPGIPFRPWSDLVGLFPVLHRFLYWAAGKSSHLMRFGMRRLVYDPRKLPAGFIRQTREMLRKPGAGLAWRRFLQAELAGNHFRHQISNQLQDIQVPTLLLHGGHDQLVPAEHSLRAAREIPAAKVLIFEMCGHWVHQEDPDLFFSSVRDFFDQ